MPSHCNDCLIKLVCNDFCDKQIKVITASINAIIFLYSKGMGSDELIDLVNKYENCIPYKDKTKVR